MFHKIVIPLDGSAFAEFALPLASAVSRRSGAGLELVMVESPEPAFAFGEWEESPQPWREEYLETMADRVGRDLDEPVSHRLRMGRAATQLERHLESSGADLLVMATHGRGPLSRFWQGSVADHLLRHATCPVLLVRPEEDEEPPPVDAVELDHILVPLDGSRLAESVLEPTFGLADLFGSKITLVGVVHFPGTVTSSYIPDSVEPSGETVAEGTARTEAYLTETAERLSRSGREVATDVRVDVHPARGILDAAEDLDIDLVAIATHGRGGVSRMVLGSVADKLVRASLRPTLVYRPPEPGEG